MAPTTRTYGAVALLSASLLAFEVLLTRVCALRLHFHFGFLVISNGLLGLGASGSLLTVTEPRWRQRPETWIWRASGAFVISLAVSWVLLSTLPVPARLTFDELEGASQLAVFNLAAALPFATGGAAVGLILSHHARAIERVYGWDLLGAGAGCLVIPFALAGVGASGAWLVITLMATTGFVLAAPVACRRPSLGAGVLVAVVALGTVPTLDERHPVPGKGYLDLTEDVRATYGDRLTYRRWSTNSRIDVLALEPHERFMFCRGPALLALPLPEQRLILQDGSAGTIVSNYTGQPEALTVLSRSLYGLGIALAQVEPEREDRGPDVLVIGMGGGDDVWATLHGGAASVRAVELNQGIVDVHRQLVPEFSRAMLDDPRLTIVVDEGRSALMRDRGRYDLIQMTGIDTWTALSSGAYVLAENYLYTVEAFGQLYDHLEPDGILQVTRMAADMETLRLISNLDAALSKRGGGELSGSVAALSTRGILTTVVLKKGRFTEREVDRLRAFAAQGGYAEVILPGRKPTNLVELYLQFEDKAAFVDKFPRDISPTDDDRPYFFSFSRWNAPAKAGAHLDEATSVSQGNPLFLLGQLAMSTAMALLFILAPLALRREGLASSTPRGRFSIYFACLGVGFIAIEVGLLQKLTLVLGKPLFSLIVTLMTLLVSSGVGSLLSKRLGERLPRVTVPAAILALVTVMAFGGDRLADTLVGLPTVPRFVATSLSIVPLGLLLGIPFALGVAKAERRDPALVPWAWAINASTTVVGSILTVIVSMNLGFSVVMVGAAGLYVLAFMVLPNAETATK